jgi:hypothetical protein
MTERTAGSSRKTAPERSATDTNGPGTVGAGTDSGAAGTAARRAPAKKAAPQRVPRQVTSADRSGQPWLASPSGMDPGGVRQRWNGTQGGFVDDPLQSVREADALATEVADAVVSAIEERRSALRSAWNDGEGTDTESLRRTLRDYRSFVKGLIGDTT